MSRAWESTLIGNFLRVGLRPCLLWCVSRVVSFALYWLPVIIWMALIFSGSGQALSVQRTSRIIGPIIHWLFPNMPQKTADQIIIAIRKCGHLVTFGMLALLLWRAIAKPSRKSKPQWRWNDVRVAFLVATGWAVLDELRQSFVPSRQGAVRDVFIDVAGAALGLLLVWLFGRVRRWW